MNIFRRPMFRGGPVDSRGTGITSGLSYKQGGRVGLRFGGSPFGAPIPPGSALNPTPTSTQLSGRPKFASRGSYQNPFKITGYTPRQFAPSGGMFSELRTLGPLLNQGIRGIGFNMPTLYAGLGAAGTVGPQVGLAYLNRPKTLAAKKFMQDFGPLDETLSEDELNAYYEEMEKLNKVGDEISFADAIFMDPETKTYPKFMGRLEDQQTLAAIKKQEDDLRNTIENQTNNTNNETTNNILNPGGDTDDVNVKDSNMEESIDIDKEKFAKALGRDKARGEDISDMLLSFSSKALAPGADVKSAFAEFAADEVKRPGRVRKIEDSAAALAINKYIKGEISKAEMSKLIALDKAKLQNKIDITRAASTFLGTLSDIASKEQKSKKNLGVIQTALRISPDTKNVPFGGPLPTGEGAAEKINLGTLYLRDSPKDKNISELVYIDPNTGELEVFETIF